MKIGWSGPRADLFADPAAARREVVRRARELLDCGDVDSFVTGGQRGVDQWAATVAQGRRLQSEIVLPCPITRFTEGWAAEDQSELEQLVGSASQVEVVDPDSLRGALAYDQRNERIVAQSQKLVVIWTGVRRGGTFYTLCAARAAEIDVEEVVLPGVTDTVLTGRGI
ncbi:MAG TPA: SLOG family protein [Chloroflexota bacterium]